MIKRIVTAMILLPSYVFIILTPYTFLLWFLTFTITCLLVYEVLNFFPDQTNKIYKILLYSLIIMVYAIKLLFFNFVYMELKTYMYINQILIFFVLLLFGYVEVFQKDFKNSVFKMNFHMFIFIYLVYCVSLIYDIRHINKYDTSLNDIGGQYLLMGGLICWLYDSGAYFGGKFFGNKKLGLVSSPNKTWMGSIIGLLVCIVGLSVFKYFINSNSFFIGAPILSLSYWFFIVLIFFLGINSQLGDLFESVLKRNARVKDSSGLIPGHGGIFDRMDSLIPTYTVLFFIIYILI